MFTTLRHLARPLATFPSYGLTRAASTNATNTPSSPPANAHGAGTSSSSQVAHISESKDVPVAAEIVSGAPGELRHRLVRIYQPTRNTMQSGGAKGEKWRIDWDILPSAGRWQNPLMGWASSADYMQATRIAFNTREDAIQFAEKQGWDYYMQPETVKRIPPKNYSENYVYKPNKLRIARTK